MKPEPWGEALDAVAGARWTSHGRGWWCPRPPGVPFTQELAAEYAR